MAGVHYIWQQMCSIRHIELSTYLQQKRRYVGMNILSWLCKTAITLDSSGTSVDIAQTGRWALYVARNVEYQPYRIVDISATATEIRAVEYLSLNLQNNNYTAYNRDQRRCSAAQHICTQCRAAWQPTVHAPSFESSIGPRTHHKDEILTAFFAHMV